MKSLRFKSLQMLSQREKKARQFEFHPNRNLISGLNHVGKSSLTKTIFETLGAYPFGELEDWDRATVSLLHLTIGEQEFHVVRQLAHRAAFNGEGELLFAASRDGEWSRAFAHFVEFNLLLTDKSQNAVTADPACMFLPFYINQDGGWGGSWHTFNGLARFHDATKSVLEYFTQIVPPKFYVAKVAADAENREVKAVDAESRILNRTRERLSRSLPVVSPQINEQAFESEIKELTRQLTGLNARQEVLRLEALSLANGLDSVNRQIALTTDSLARFGDDFKFLSRPRKEDLSCPTCGAHHEESFLKVLSFAEDARALSEMLIRLQETRSRLLTQLETTVEQRSELTNSYQQLDSLLEQKRGEVKFLDVVQSIGSGEALRAFDEEEASLELRRSGHLSRAHQFELDMKELASRKRRAKINKFFRDRYATARNFLHLNAKDARSTSVSKRPKLSGSGGPRDVLAYYAALWWTSHEEEFGSPFAIPVIVDCPAQSGQDEFNMPAIMTFLSTGLPPDSQLLVTHESDVSDAFDNRIVLDRPYSILYESEYESVATAILPKLEAMQSALLKARMPTKDAGD
jgi:hypothetical protein